jgi:hypothetical protein
MKETWELVAVQDIAENLYENAKDMDSLDYEEEREETIKELENAIYQLKAICQNPYNSDYYRVFYNALVHSLNIPY